MEMVSDNIHPIFHELLSRSDKEQFLNQNARVIWFTGLSGSGKSTVAKGVEKELHKLKILTEVLDGDNVRSGINNNLGFSDEDRQENIRRIAEVAKLFLNCGIVTLCSFVSPTLQIRNLAKKIVGEENFVEIFIDTPLEICERRDVKGLYKKARAGEIKDFTGIDAPFEAPEQPSLIVKTENQTIEESIAEVMEHILPMVKK